MTHHPSRLLLCLVALAPLTAIADPVTTKGIIDIKKLKRPADATQLVGAKGHQMISEKKDVKNNWVFKDGVLTASPLWDSVITKESYQDFQMHVEFNVNEVPDVDAEKNGNSGVYIQQRYELQILNSFGIAKEDYKASYCGSLYRQKMPDRLVCKKAGEWQTYDIVFRAARFKGDKKTENARITAYQNGELIHDDHSIKNKTGAGQKEGPEPGPIKLQGHHNPVRFRNVWIKKLKLEAKKAAPPKKKKGYTYVIPFDQIPPAPALTPKKALGSFKLHEDFAINLAASDPNIQNPVALRFDGNGRMWVVEMRAYMPNANGEGEDEPIGRISILTDHDQDGTFEDYKVFMDGLVLPRAIAFYKGGILYGSHEKLYFVENNNDRAGKMTVIDEHYTKNENVEHRSNGLMRGMDNWIYNVKSDMRYREVDGKWVKERSYFRGQWGMSQNNYGRLFYNQNWFGMQADQLLPHTLMRNPNFLKSGGDTAAISYRDKIYPARITPGVNRGGEGAIDDKGYLTAVTASCGPVVYRGDQFPEDYRNTAFFCEPAAHFVRILKVAEKDGKLIGSHLLESEKREFLASTDERFRPVNLFNGPDGTLYMVDLYHGIVQHKHYLTRYLREHVEHRDLASHPRLGRVYRVAHKATPIKKYPQLLGMSAAQLVPFLADSNGWRRDTVQQLLIDRADLSIVAALNSMAADSEKPLGQIHALWTLEGLGSLNTTALGTALQSDNPHVLEMAIRLTELLPAKEATSLLPQIKKLTARSELVVQRQLASSLGRLPGDESLELLKSVLQKHINDPWFREAAIHGLAGRELRFQELLGSEFADAKFKEYLTHCLTIKTTAAAYKLPRDKEHLASFKRGEAFYIATCLACHGPDGNGLENLGPPLTGSEWSTGSPKRLSAILLQGMMGPITVKGKQYTPAAAMPGLKAIPGVTDTKLADVATFVRFAWNNGKGRIKPDMISEVRKELGDRQTVLSPEEVMELYPK